MSDDTHNQITGSLLLFAPFIDILLRPSLLLKSVFEPQRTKHLISALLKRLFHGSEIRFQFLVRHTGKLMRDKYPLHLFLPLIDK